MISKFRRLVYLRLEACRLAIMRYGNRNLRLKDFRPRLLEIGPHSRYLREQCNHHSNIYENSQHCKAIIAPIDHDSFRRGWKGSGI